MAQIIYFNKHRAEKLLQRSAITAYVLTGGIVGLPEHVAQNFRQVVPLRLGHQLSPPAGLRENTETYFEVDMSFGGRSHTLGIPWAAVVRVEPFLPPSGGGGGGRRAAA